VYTLSFAGTYGDVRHAGIDFRVAVGAIKPLADSYVGKTPAVWSEMINKPSAKEISEHEAIRKFKTEKELAEFFDYMSNLPILSERAPIIERPTGENKRWRFVTSGRLAEIVIEEIGGEWHVRGCAKFFGRPNVVKKIFDGIKNCFLTVEVEEYAAA
jgi:hypothetical protein